ncbi:porin [Peteryoungia algae]|uniref:Porin n=1 Tax=Peteryoungia algae TaxID=2919917 RepID=A0ABT0D467_9HYPH|nr:porin [Rhizobium sp. SSM4.3]MCJ8240205.1 porin [Rhizobium sp. SSM4.3]
MNIKSLLLGSAAALAVVSGAQAADAIVAAEPEPMEYVRVCDAFGTGYFYIPGTETCLKIGGEVRVTLSANENSGLFGTTTTNDDWDSAVRARLSFEAKNDSELGTIGSYIRIQADSQGATTSGVGVTLDQAYITVGGFKVGRAVTFADDWGLAGESDSFFGNTKFNMASYTYSADAFTVGLGIDDLSDSGAVAGTPGFLGGGNEVGLEGVVSASLGMATVTVNGVYDFGSEEGAIAGVIAADVGPGTFALAAAWASGQSTGYDFTSEWTVGAAYTFKATDKLSITPQVVYWGDYGFNAAGNDAWGADLLVEYKLAAGLTASADVRYRDLENSGDNWDGFVRLTRSF